MFFLIKDIIYKLTIVICKYQFRNYNPMEISCLAVMYDVMIQYTNKCDTCTMLWFNILISMIHVQCYDSIY